MTKYYRVRTQEQWDWLMKWFEEQSENILWTGDILPAKVANPYNDDKCVVSLENNKLMHGDVRYFKRSENITDFIEVSQMMEESRMEDYVTIDSGDFDKIKFDRPQEDGNSFVVKKVNVMGYDTGKYVRDVELPTDLLIPKSLLYPKARMSVAEKKEFDWLKDNAGSLYYALDYIDEERYNRGTIPHLFDVIYGDDAKMKEIDFARAWADPSLIEVIPEDKYWVKCYPTDDCYFYKYEGKILAGVPRVHLERFQFTTDEIVEYHLDGTENIFEKVEVSE